jgi:hypothetical protein
MRNLVVHLSLLFQPGEIRALKPNLYVTHTRISFVPSQEAFLGKMKWLIAEVIDTEMQ